MRNDWMSCDGDGNLREPKAFVRQAERGEPSGVSVSRRHVLTGAALGALAWASGRRSALSQIAVRPKESRTRDDVLVVIFLRGGLDGLNAVVPFGEDAYHRLRPTLGLSPPGDRAAATIDRTLDLDGFFGLNAALGPLLPHYREGRLAILHAVGSDDRTRSHFEAMSAMERGLETAKGDANNGWLARYLNASTPEKASPLRAVALTNVMPDSLRGATHAIALNSLNDFRLASPESERTLRFQADLATLYAGGKDAVAEAGRQTLEVLDELNGLDPTRYRPSGGAVYPQNDIGEALKQVAILVKADLGLEVACLDKGGWDTHFAQGRSGGLLFGLLDDLAKALAAFLSDLGSDMKRVTVVVQTEFGRRSYENTTLGTDHGRGSVMFLLGAGVQGGKVHGRWPGMEPHQLEEPGDLGVTTDYRSVLAEVLARRMGFAESGEVFPGLQASNVGVVA